MPRMLLGTARRATLVVPLLALAACATATAETPASTPAATSTATATTASSPATIDNCGTTITPDGTPERIVTVKSTTTELLIELGLADRIAGAGFLDGPIEAPYTATDVDIPVISDFLPGPEATLDLDPDALVGGWESNFAADGLGERAALADLGILTYVAPSACKEAGYMPDPMTFDLLWEQIEEAGRVFGAEDAAAALVETMRTGLEGIDPSTAGLTAVWYSSGDDAPYVGAGIGAPQMMMDAAGLTNVFADVHDTWTSATWEAVVAADPDVIVLIDATWNTAASKIEALEANPATAALTAVKERHYVTIPFAAGEAGVRNVKAVESILEQLGALGLS